LIFINFFLDEIIYKVDVAEFICFSGMKTKHCLVCTAVYRYFSLSVSEIHSQKLVEQVE